MPPTLGTLKVTADDPTADKARVWLNGVEITNCVTSVTVRMVAGELNQADLTVILDRVELDSTIADLAVEALASRPVVVVPA